MTNVPGIHSAMTNVPGIHSEVQFSVNDRDKWAELGLAIQHLYHDQHVNGQNDDKGPMMMNGLPLGIPSRHWKIVYSQTQHLSRAVIYQSQDIIKEIIDEHFFFTDVPPHYKGQMWAVEYFQRIKVLLQNRIFESTDSICTMLRQAMNRPVTRLSEFVTAETSGNLYH